MLLFANIRGAIVENILNGVKSVRHVGKSASGELNEEEFSDTAIHRVSVQPQYHEDDDLTLVVYFGVGNLEPGSES